MKQIIIKYDTDFQQWSEEVEKCLIYNNIIYDSDIITSICNSIDLCCIKCLKENKFQPKHTLKYRSNLVNKLRYNKMKISIVSNNLLWLYLSTFSDLTDYTKCFNVSLLPIDEAIKTDRTVYKSLVTHSYNTINNNIDLFKETKNVDILVKILKQLNRKGEIV